jgi:hypothetical protein
MQFSVSPSLTSPRILQRCSKQCDRQIRIVVHTVTGFEDIRLDEPPAGAVTYFTTTTRSIDMHIIHVQPKRPMALPAYFLGRPAELCRRHYRRVPASITPLP